MGAWNVLRLGALTMALAWCGQIARASPSLSLDDPLYEELARLRALGRIEPFGGGLQPITEWRASELLGAARGSTRALVGAGTPRWWLVPVHRAMLRLSLVREATRMFSTALRPRDLTVGSVSLSCEHDEGRPCGDAARMLGELETSLGYGRWLSGWSRVQATTTLSDGSDATLAQGELSVETDHIAAVAGRSVLALGPARHAQTAWSRHAPPLDHVRVFTPRGLRITDALAANATYVLGRLRAPQMYPGTLVSIGRVQADISGNIELGMMQLLQLGGAGARELDVIDFVLEHVRRKDLSAGPTDSSNRRVGFDIAGRIAALSGIRLYYAATFEDWRRDRFIDALRYDADHTFGADLAALGDDGQHGLLIELHTTGFRAYEHTDRKTGFTNRGYVVGSPLGPDATALYIRGRVRIGATTLYPWIERATLRSDEYELVVDGPINRISAGPEETRYRVGAGARVALRPGLWAEADVVLEHVRGFAFDIADNRTSSALTVSVMWYPQSVLGTL